MCRMLPRLLARRHSLLVIFVRPLEVLPASRLSLPFPSLPFPAHESPSERAGFATRRHRPPASARRRDTGTACVIRPKAPPPATPSHRRRGRLQTRPSVTRTRACPWGSNGTGRSPRRAPPARWMRGGWEEGWEEAEEDADFGRAPMAASCGTAGVKAGARGAEASWHAPRRGDTQVCAKTCS